VLEIGEIDGDLGEVAGFQLDAHGFDVTEAAGGKADGFGNFVGDADERFGKIKPRKKLFDIALRLI